MAGRSSSSAQTPPPCLARSATLNAMAALREEGVRRLSERRRYDRQRHVHLSEFNAANEFVLLRRPRGSVLLAPQLEAGPAREEAEADAVRSFGEFVVEEVPSDPDTTPGDRRIP